MHINIHLLVIFTLIGGLIIQFWPRHLERSSRCTMLPIPD